MKPSNSSSLCARSRPILAVRSSRAARRVGIALLLGGAAFGAMAQYKIVGPDGRVTYTDKPPTASDIRIGNGAAASPDAGGGGLPYDGRQAAARYPVTLYAAKNCDACDQARQWLRGHSIPFNEYSVGTNGDLLQLRQRFGDNTIPVVTIGSQALKGYSASDLQSYADAAGYPKQARLTGYTWPAAVPLAPAAPATPTAAASTAPTPAVTLPPPSKNGIQF